MTKVLYVAGWQRSGTTLLGDLLGSYSAAFHIGELTYLFTPTHPAGGLCGCGSPLEECPLWVPALETSGLRDSRHLAHQARLASARMRQVPRALLAWKRSGTRTEYSHVLGKIYPAIAAASNTEIIIDSSKSPGEALASITAPGVEAKVLHLVRDPRGCAYSISRRAKKHYPNSQQAMVTRTPRQSSTRWLEVNGLLESIRATTASETFKTIMYEDFMRHPRRVVEDIAAWAGMDSTPSPFTSDADATLEVCHTVMGNPNRFSDRHVSMAIDNEWRTSMPRRDMWSATLPAAPLMHRYGYPLLPATIDRDGPH